MWVVGHAQVGWLLARGGRLEWRDRCLVTLCGVLPDVDAATRLLGVDAYLRGHHVYLHNLLVATIAAVAAALLAMRRGVVLALGLLAFLLHLASDGLGLLQLQPLWPFSDRLWWPSGGDFRIAFVGEIAIPVALVAWGVSIFVREQRSVLEVLSPRIDRAMADALERRARGERRPDARSPARRGVENVVGGVILYATLAAACQALLAVIAEPSWRLALLVALPSFVVVRWVAPWIAGLALDRLAHALRDVRSGHLELRPVRDEDLPVFFEHQIDPEANRMAAFTAKHPDDREAFDARWARNRADASIVIRTIVVDGRVVGSVLKYETDGRPEISYWIGREHWGRGIATRALAAFLDVVPARPMFARTAKDNVASQRVLRRCGFVRCGESRGFANARGEEIDELLLVLGPPWDAAALPR